MSEKNFCIFKHVTTKQDDLNFISCYLPKGDFKNIVIKPNWVYHQTTAKYPINALITDVRLIDMTIQACLSEYPNCDKISIVDVPLQSCDFEVLKIQSNLNEVIKKYTAQSRIKFMDLRREIWKYDAGFLKRRQYKNIGDPLGYHEIVLNDESLLKEINNNVKNFRVSDYDTSIIQQMHTNKNHKYIISKTILDSDLVISLPKLKTHQKTGTTCALKNMVGIVGDKACLVHHQKGKKKSGGDEFSDHTSSLIILQTRLREILQKKHPSIYRFLSYLWSAIKISANIKTEPTLEELVSKKSVYIGAGSWYGNDSIWRMVYDLNLILLYGSLAKSTLSTKRQREYICIVDGVVCGQGNGPLQSIPVKLDIIGLSNNPFLMDISCAKLMGFDYTKIPILNNHHRFGEGKWGNFIPEDQTIMFDNITFKGIHALPVLHNFIPAPGWRNHIELC